MEVKPLSFDELHAKPVQGTDVSEQVMFEKGYIGTLIKSSIKSQTNAPSSVHSQQTPPDEVSAEPDLVEQLQEQINQLQKKIEEVKKSRFDEGYQKAKEEMDQEAVHLKSKEVELMESVSQNLTKAITTIEAQGKRDIADIVDVAKVMVRKMVGEQLSDHYCQEIEAMLRQTMQLLFDKPKITVHVHPDNGNFISHKLEHIRQVENFEGDVELVMNTNLGLMDVEITWIGGGMTNHKEAIWQEIEALCKSTVEDFVEV